MREVTTALKEKVRRKLEDPASKQSLGDVSVLYGTIYELATGSALADKKIIDYLYAYELYLIQWIRNLPQPSSIPREMYDSERERAIRRVKFIYSFLERYYMKRVEY